MRSAFRPLVPLGYKATKPKFSPKSNVYLSENEGGILKNRNKWGSAGPSGLEKLWGIHLTWPPGIRFDPGSYILAFSPGVKKCARDGAAYSLKN
jgi:hypothetical protein